MVKSVLFVCTGNICRSPIAEGLFRRLLGNRKDIEVASAGVHAVRGQPPSLYAVQVCEEAVVIGDPVERRGREDQVDGLLDLELGEVGDEIGRPISESLLRLLDHRLVVVLEIHRQTREGILHSPAAVAGVRARRLQFDGSVFVLSLL